MVRLRDTWERFEMYFFLFIESNSCIFAIQNVKKSKFCIDFAFKIRVVDLRGRPQSRPVVITIFTQSVRPSVRPKTVPLQR